MTKTIETKTNMKVKSAIGEFLNLGSELGKGGEATVHHVIDDSTLCAKIYKNPQKAANLEKKVEAMVDFYKAVRSRRGEGERFFDKHLAWPRLKLYDVNTGKFLGFIMNKLPLRMGLDTFLDDAMRNEKSWDKRLGIAISLLRVIKGLHDNGIIVGDLHKGNTFVLPENEIALVDCDSFQIGNKFRCSALLPEIAPPEAKYQDIFDASADIFTACVLIYRLLMDGFNPFAFIQEGSFEPDLEQSKASGFAPIRDNKLKLPPESPPLKRLPDDARNIFAKALGPDPKNRPSIDEVINAVEIVKNNVKTPLVIKKQTVNISRTVLKQITHTTARKRRNKFIAAGVGIVVLIFVIVSITVSNVGRKNDKHAQSTVSKPTSFLVIIDSSPSGATVLIDKKQVGITPLSITLGKGSHGIRVEKEGYESAYKITEGENREFNFKLKEE